MVKNRIIPYEILLESCKQTLGLVEYSIPEEELIPMRHFMNALIHYLEDCINKAENGWPVIGHHFAFPSEIFYFFDVVPIVVEGVSYMLSGLLTEGAEPYYDAIEFRGHPYHTCSAQKATLGLTLEDYFKFDVICTSSGPCDNSIASYPIFRHIQKGQLLDFKVIDMPYWRDKRSCDFFGEELVNLRDELAIILGQEPDEEKFRKAIEVENKSLQLIKELNEIKKAVPCPVESMNVPFNAASIIFFSGRFERIPYLEALISHAKKNYKKGIKPNGEEKLRTIWPNMTLFFDIGYSEQLDREKGISTLFDIFNYVFYDPINLNQDINDIIKDLSVQCMDYPMIRQSQSTADRMIEDMLYLCREYKVDACIFTNHIACKNLQPIIQLLREALREELGISLLSVDVDVGDKRYASKESIAKEIDSFVSTLY